MDGGEGIKARGCEFRGRVWERVDMRLEARGWRRGNRGKGIQSERTEARGTDEARVVAKGMGA